MGYKRVRLGMESVGGCKNGIAHFMEVGNNVCECMWAVRSMKFG